MAAKTNWYRTTAFILIPSLLIAALFLAKPHKTKLQPLEDRLHWSAAAVGYTPNTDAAKSARAPEELTKPERRLNIAPNALDASLQVSIRVKPYEDPNSPIVNPSGSGTLKIGGEKYMFFIDSTAAFTRYQLADGSVYVRGPMTIIVRTPDGDEKVTIGVSSVLGLSSKEGDWTYTNPDGQGVIRFGAGFSTAHTDEIAAKQ